LEIVLSARDRSWFECWKDPIEFFRTAHQQILASPISKSIPNYLGEAYVAGLFARIQNDHRGCEVRLIPERDRFPDAQLKESGKIIDLEIVIADRKDRRMFAELAELERMRLCGEIQRVRISGEEETQLRQAQAREAIPRVCRKKVIKYMGSANSEKIVSASLVI
jgi:hypothetical protein